VIERAVAEGVAARPAGSDGDSEAFVRQRFWHARLLPFVKGDGGAAD
jgi:hypothetical protein